MSAALVCLLHGSRDARWRASTERLVAAVSVHLPAPVRLAYMSYGGPSLKAVANEIVAAGGTAIKVWPLFLAGGGHVDKDVPELVAGVRAALPGLEVELLPPLGEHPELPQALAALAKRFMDAP